MTELFISPFYSVAVSRRGHVELLTRSFLTVLYTPPEDPKQVSLPALNDRGPSYPIVNQIVHPPEVEAASSSDTELV